MDEKKRRSDKQDRDRKRQFQVAGDSDEATENLPATTPRTDTADESSESDSSKKKS